MMDPACRLMFIIIFMFLMLNLNIANIARNGLPTMQSISVVHRQL